MDERWKKVQICAQKLQMLTKRFEGTPSSSVVWKQLKNEHSIIPLVLTYHPTNQLLKNIISRNFYLLCDDPETAAIFQPLHILYAYRRDQNLRDYLVRSTLTNPTSADEDRGTFPVADLASTPASIPTPAQFSILQVDASILNRNVPVPARTWFML